jgi:hypothetical protein
MAPLPAVFRQSHPASKATANNASAADSDVECVRATEARLQQAAALLSFSASCGGVCVDGPNDRQRLTTQSTRHTLPAGQGEPTSTSCPFTGECLSLGGDKPKTGLSRSGPTSLDSLSSCVSRWLRFCLSAPSGVVLRAPVELRGRLSDYGCRNRASCCPYGPV